MSNRPKKGLPSKSTRLIPSHPPTPFFPLPFAFTGIPRFYRSRNGEGLVSFIMWIMSGGNRTFLSIFCFWVLLWMQTDSKNGAGNKATGWPQAIKYNVIINIHDVLYLVVSHGQDQFLWDQMAKEADLIGFDLVAIDLVKGSCMYHGVSWCMR